MGVRTSRLPSPLVAIDPEQRLPLHRQLYDAIRAAVVRGDLAAGAQLPSTRELASDLGVSRVTVSMAFDQLRVEGYLETRQGSGTFVPRGLPDAARRTRRRPRSSTSPREVAPISATRMEIATPHAQTGEPIETRSTGSRPVAFRTGVPALDEFPVALWAKLTARCWRGVVSGEAAQLLDYGHPLGYAPLRAAIADYVTLSRGARCVPGQVIVTAGAQQALALIARVLLESGDAAWLEDPGYFGAREALEGAGATIVPVPVDEEGLDPVAGEALDPTARLVYVAPSHQYPLGVTMTMRRRLALLDWAARAGAWIVEDDYDGEFRYVGRPLASLQGLDAERRETGLAGDHGRVLYVGTFSKTLFPSLRLGYLIVPESLVETFGVAKGAADGHTAIVEQAVLTEFIVDGHYARHIRRMRLLYAARQRTLLAASSAHLARWLDVRPAAAGMHLVGWLRPELTNAGVSDRMLVDIASAAGVFVTALSPYRARSRGRGEKRTSLKAPDGLLLGYACCSEQTIWDGAQRLERAIADCMRSRIG